MTTSMKRSRARLGVVLPAMLAYGLSALPAMGAMPEWSEDGWHTWRVDATDTAPDWCCVVLRNDTVVRRVCDLDSRDHGYAATGAATAHPEQMQIYAHIVDGQPDALRALSPTCSVSTDQEIVEHGELAAADSVAWLAAQVTPRSDLSTQALGAIAVHAGKLASRTLVRTARRDANFENRKDAVFWMGQVRGEELREDLTAMMFDDPRAAMRKHAAFSWSQSGVPDRADALIELGKRDAAPEVRGQAWFWLAQTGDARSEGAILAALETESSTDLRPEMIFALSQLPGDRGVEALIAVIENRRLAGDDRERALFWMAQSDSDRAASYLATVLD